MDAHHSAWKELARIGITPERVIEMMQAIISPIGPGGRVDSRALTGLRITDHHDGAQDIAVQFASQREARELLTGLGIDAAAALGASVSAAAHAPVDTSHPWEFELVDPNVRSLRGWVPVRVVAHPTVQSEVGDAR